jgi:hypothetical protein
MRDENVGVNPTIAVKLRQAIAQHAQAGAAIQNETRAAGRSQFQARRVAAVPPGGLINGGS